MIAVLITRMSAQSPSRCVTCRNWVKLDPHLRLAVSGLGLLFVHSLLLSVIRIYTLITILVPFSLFLLSVRVWQRRAAIIGTSLGYSACNMATIDLIIKRRLVLGYASALYEVSDRKVRFHRKVMFTVSLLRRSRSKTVMDPESRGCNDLFLTP